MQADVLTYFPDNTDNITASVLFLEETLHPISTGLLMDLLGQGIKVDIAYNGELGLGLIARNKYDLIVSGLMLNKVSGFDVLDITRNTPEMASTKFLVHSGLSSAKDKKKVKALKADDYVDANAASKNDLLKRIYKQLGIKPKN